MFLVVHFSSFLSEIRICDCKHAICCCCTIINSLFGIISMLILGSHSYVDEMQINILGWKMYITLKVLISPSELSTYLHFSQSLLWLLPLIFSIPPTSEVAVFFFLFNWLYAEERISYSASVFSCSNVSKVKSIIDLVHPVWGATQDWLLVVL